MLKAIRRLWKIIKQLFKQPTRPTTTVIAAVYLVARCAVHAAKIGYCQSVVFFIPIS